MTKIVDELFKLAKIENLSQKEISKRSGLAEETLSRAKRHGNMNAENIEKIADALGYEIVLKKIRYPVLLTSCSAWSSPSLRNHLSRLAARLAYASFKDLLDLSLIHGVSKVEETMEKIRHEITVRRYDFQKSMLNNIKKALTPEDPDICATTETTKKT